MTEKDKQDLMADLFGGSHTKKRYENSSGAKQEGLFYISYGKLF